MTTSLSFPQQLNRIRDAVLAQENTLREVAACYADAFASGGVVHVYANGHSRMTVEEMVIRMGALTGFHAVLSGALATFTDVIGADGLRINQTIEKVEGLGAKLLDEFEVGPGEPLIAISATGQTQAAVDIALEWIRRYPDNPLIAICSLEQSRSSPPKHSSGKTLYHAVAEAKKGWLLDNGMPCGDLSVTVEGQHDTYHVCPLSSIGALTVVQSLNELTIRELDRRGIRHPVLRNMHLGQTQVNYDEWLLDQRRRYARTLVHPNPVAPRKD
jgi:uncharacterized phosphosugar-binding protein